MMLKRFSAAIAAVSSVGVRALPSALALILLVPAASWADNVVQPIPFAQNWSNTGLITVDDNWSGVPGIEGYRGDNLTGGTGTDPQTLLAADAAPVIDVIANQNNPGGLATGGVGEFDGIANPVVALQGSGTADAPYVQFYLNTTACTGINIAYNLRDIDGSADNAVQPVAMHFRVGNAGAFTNVPAAFVADATTGPSLATLVTPVSALLPPAADNQAQVQVRLMTTNAVGNDEWVGIDDLSVTGTCGGGPILSIDDVSVTEGNGGTVNAVFTVSLSAPAGAGGVGFNIATQDNTATVANNDYVSNSLLAQTIPAGSSSYQFTVVVNGDTAPEPNETFFVNVTGVSNATVGDGQGQGTIVNDDITNINVIQGPGTSSPLAGGTVLTRGIVYAVRTNGFFIQNAPGDTDANPLTSEGLFVFTGGAPPAAAAVGNLVRVSGTVVEFVPPSDPGQPPLTELGGAITVAVESAGNPLPVPTTLTTALPSPAGAFDQLERLEGMRVTVPAFTVNSSSNGNVNEPNATGSNNGVFHGYVAGAVPRSLREPGIQPPDAPPAGTGTIPPIPRWDGNPELLRVDSDALPGTTALVVGFGQTVNNLTGPLDYGFRRYTIFPEPAPTAPPTVTGSIVSGVVTAPTASEVTIASYNLQRFFDTVNDPAIGEPVLTATAFNNRLNKASLGIRNSLRTPDIVGVVEVENLTTLQALATRINSDAVAAAQPDPMYVAYLVEGNDPGGIDVGFLVKTAPAFAATPRVSVTEVVQELDGSLLTNPDMSTATLHDRPPLRLTGVVTRSTGQAYPLTVIVNHLRSFNDATDPTPGSNGWPTEGHRVRAKRQAQAADLANFVQARQTTSPAEQIVLVGDFNAFEFNDGLGDLMGTIAGTPSPDNTTAVPGDGIDLVNPDLDNLFDTVAAVGRYSYNFDGVAQSLDHALVSASVNANTVAPRIEHAHINADFPEIERSNAASPNRLSDHDPLVVYLTPNGFVPIEVSIAKASSNPTPIAGGPTFTYTVTVVNGGPQAAANVAFTDVLPAGVVFQSLTPVVGWSCTTPAVGANGTVSCSTASMPVSSASFQIVVSVPANVLPGPVTNTATVTTSSVDINPANNSASAQVTIQTQADLSITLTDSPDPVTAGTNLTYVATLANAGPSDAQGATITLPLPAGTSFVSATPSAGGSCNAASPVVCTWAGATIPGASRTATIVVLVAPSVLDGTVLSATATASSTTTDPNPANNTATTTTTVIARADLQIGLSASVPQVLINVPVTFTATSLNAGPSDAQNVSITLTLTPDFRYSSHTAPGATCTTPQIGNTGAIVCTWAGATAPGVTRTLTVVAFSNVEGNTGVNASTTSNTVDPNPNNNTANITVIVGYPFNEIPTLSQWGLLLLGLLMAGVGLVAVRRQF